MATFFMFGNYTPDALKGISAQRTKEAAGLIKKCGGEIKEVYSLLGPHDIVIIADLPSIEAATKASIAVSRATGIGFQTAPALSAEAFDKAVGEL